MTSISPANAAPPLRVLFVDDETRILDGLRRALRAHRGSWDLRFATGGAAAIAEMERLPADLVISDMRMPGMDGAALLAAIRIRWPHAARIVLSGQSDAEAGLAAIRSAHQFLNKPCEHEAIVALIERIARLTAMVPDVEQRALAGGLAALAPRPCSRAALERVLADPHARPAALMPVIATDIALASKVLQLASTAFFVRTHPFTDLETAVGCLGIEPLRALADSCALTEDAITDPEWLEAHHAEGVRQARATREATGPTRIGGLAYLAGLFSDLGRLVQASSPEPRTATTSPMIGAWLLGVWGIAWPLVEAVANAARARSVTTPDTITDSGGIAA